MVVSLVVVVFAGSSLLLRIASICIILRHMRLQLQRLSSNHQLLCKNVVLKTSDTIYHFRVKLAETIKMAEDQLFICWCKLFTLRCLRVKNFFRLLNDYGCKYGYKSCCGCLYYSCLCYCALPRLNVHNIPPYRTTAAEAFISSSAVVQEGSPKDQWCYLLFQSKERLRLSKWPGRELLHMDGLGYWHFHFLSCSSQLKVFLDALKSKN